jgi:SagB-type dehydrogenase family enzyme
MKSLLAYPRLSPTVTLLPAESGVIVDGTLQMNMLKGVAADTVIPHLIPLLDGTRSVAGIVAHLHEIPEEYVNSTLATLYDLGLLEDSGGTLSDVGEGFAAFLSRCRLIYAQGDSTHSCSERLESSQVTVERPPNSDGKFNDSICSMLRGCHIRDVVYSESSSVTRPFGNVGRFVIRKQLNASADISLSCPPQVIDVTYVHDSNRLLFRSVVCNDAPGLSCCDLFYQDYLPQCAGNVPQSIPSELITSIVVAEVVDCILGVPHALRGRRCREYSLNTLESVVRQYPCSSLCHGCARACADGASAHAPMSTMSSATYNTALVFSEFIGAASDNERYTEQRTFFQDRPRQSLGALCSKAIALPVSGVDLCVDTLRVLSGNCMPRSGVASLAHLAALCSLSVGIRERSERAIHRWAPTAGNLGAPRLHVITPGLDGLGAGVYSYDAVTHALYPRQGHCGAPVERLLDKFVTPLWRRHPTLLVYTVRRDALQPKYGAFSYKLGFLDGGCTLSQARTVAAAMGIVTEIVNCWPDSVVRDAIGSLHDTEDIAAIVAFHRPGSRFATYCRKWYASDAALHETSDLRNLSIADLTETLAKECRTSSKSLQPRAIGVSKLVYGSQNAPIALPSCTGCGLPVDQMLLHRKSTREFSSEPITAEQLSSALYGASSCDLREWKVANELGITLVYYVLCISVDAIDRGAYVYSPGVRQLVPLNSLPADSLLSSIYVQKECASSAVTVIIAADISRVTKVLGGFGFRHILVRAGAAAHRISMAAFAHGLGSVVLGGIVPEAVDTVVGRRDINESLLIGSIIGHCATK